MVYQGGNASAGNGYHVVLSHDLNGTKVYSLYSHLSTYSACPSVGSNVKKGTKIGVMGNTGNSTGPHLHFAIFTKKSTDPYGYSYNPVKNYKTSRGGYTFYDPSYVINYGKLP
ncbi:MAG: M23 family metallopeptidase [Clostridia bacterium]|nr:M23 family metallopeptidase [Clostridia bacterium]MBQ8765813.1 M23 family metallopeptidase [Clostridia bacterium]